MFRDSREAECQIGRHVLADLSGVDPEALQDVECLSFLMWTVLLSEGFPVLAERTFIFPGTRSGVSGVFFLSDIHAAFHTYPEHRYLALDVFSHGTHDPSRVAKIIASTMGGELSGLSIPRGIVLPYQ
ncbi:S-adenosylmethionine decarboxylase [Inquilinus limosus]|uniref:S-adenosylmethionine decarboxylase n=1 Tax=Inquilinus limosus TaxID=171674 RepID=UPI003F16420C